MARRTKRRGISRIDSGFTHGWFVRGYKNGKTFPKLFSDRKCGGKKEALEMAIAYRDELHSKLEFQREGPRAFHGYLGTRAGRAEMHFILNPQIRREEGFPVSGSTP